jgi:GNAT superfamily N-acetyltransferase
VATTFRPAVEGDIPALADTECRAFGRDDPGSREYKCLELERELAEYVVLLDDQSPTGVSGVPEGRPTGGSRVPEPDLVACARIRRDWLWVGASRVSKGDVGHVAVLPEAQGRGYGTTLMQRVIPHLRDSGFHISRLGGLMKFYTRFGYEPFPRRYVQIPVQPLDYDLKGCRWADLHAIPDAIADNLKYYNPSRHALAVHDLRLRFGRHRSGSPVLDETPPPPTTDGVNLKGLDWVYEVQGKVVGFLRGGHGLVNADDTAPSFRLDDFAYDCEHPEAVEALVKTLMWRAIHEAPTVISCRLPYDERLFNALTAAGIAFDVVEMRQSVDGNMMQVVDLPGTLEAIRPELLRRLENARTPLWRGRVRFQLPGQRGVLELGGQEEAVVRCNHADFIKLLFGIVGFGEEMPHLSAELTAEQRLTLGVLFPRTACASGAWG